MGEILRSTFQKAKDDPFYANLLSQEYDISKENNIFHCVDTTEELTKKVLSYLPALQSYFHRDGMDKFTSQVDWLEFCTMQGLLVPNRWTQNFLAAHLKYSKNLHLHPFILDGYPRTVAAAKHLLHLLQGFDIPVIKVLHLSISKQEMLSRGLQRGRADDGEMALLSRYHFYIENVQPSVDYLKMELGADVIALIDAHQPVYVTDDAGVKRLDLEKSIDNVVASALRSLGVPRVIVRDLLV